MKPRIDQPETSPEVPHGRLLSRLAILSALSAIPACTPHQPAVSQPAYESENTYNRKAPEIVPKYPESVDIAEKYAPLKGYMHPEEVQRMQFVHDELYEQYINPSFILHLKQMNLNDVAFPNLDLVLRHPYDFDYEQKAHKRIEIRKRRPFTDKNEHIPNDFLLVIDGTEPETVQFNLNNLRMPDATLPWSTSEQFHSRSDLYQNMYRNEWRRNLYGQRYRDWLANGQQPPQEWNEIFRNSFGGIRPELKEIYEAMNIDFPRRYVEMVRARGFDFELNDPRFQDIAAHQQRQGLTFDAITRDGYGPNGGLQIRVSANQDAQLTERFGPVYMVLTRGNTRNPIFITDKGHMLRRINGQWEMDPRSTDTLKRKYYADHPQAPRP